MPFAAVLIEVSPAEARVRPRGRRVLAFADAVDPVDRPAPHAGLDLNGLERVGELLRGHLLGHDLGERGVGGGDRAGVRAHGGAEVGREGISERSSARGRNRGRVVVRHGGGIDGNQVTDSRVLLFRHSDGVVDHDGRSGEGAVVGVG